MISRFILPHSKSVFIGTSHASTFGSRLLSLWKGNELEPIPAFGGYKNEHVLDLHRQPASIRDKIAKAMVTMFKVPTDWFFGKRLAHRAVVIETVAAVPGLVGGLFVHLKSLRRIRHDHGWTNTLLQEAENEKLHLMTFREIAKPNIVDKLFIRAAQISFFGIYTMVYAISPATAHRMIGYIEEEAIHSYSHFIREVEAGNIPNVPAPKIAIQYWNLDEKAKLKDLLFAIRDDEMEHRDVNHNFADQILNNPSSTPHGP